MTERKRRALGVIPARGGSKGIPGKNVRPLAGKPLIVHSIESAQAARSLDRVIVSTDSDEISDVARRYGADVPFRRPSELATDKALSVDVIIHAIKALGEMGDHFDDVVLLQPTTPLRSAADIDRAIALLRETSCDSVVSMVDVGANHPARMYRLKEGRIDPIMGESVTMMPRQALESIYIRSGDIYAARVGSVVEHHSMIGPDCRALVIDPTRAVNIDAPLDFFIAEHLLTQRP